MILLETKYDWPEMLNSFCSTYSRKRKSWPACTKALPQLFKIQFINCFVNRRISGPGPAKVIEGVIISSNTSLYNKKKPNNTIT